MNFLNNIALSIGILIILLALVTLITSIVLEMVVRDIKNKNKKLIPTNTEGEHRIEYNIPTKFKKIVKLNQSLLEYKSFIKLSLVMGAVFASLPLLQLLMSTIPTFPK